VAQTDYEPNVNTCLNEGYDVVVTVGFLIGDVTLASAQANPDVFFIGVDQFFTDAPDNLVGIQYREDQAGFLVGAMAALMTESGTVAGVYGIDIPPVVKFRNGFEQGAKYINPDIELLGVYIDDFYAPDRGAAAAEQFIGEGADVIFGAGLPDRSAASSAPPRWMWSSASTRTSTSPPSRRRDARADKLISSAEAVDLGVYHAGWSGGCA
jgi:basic membrane lipoprotein Med (substrate-binding protein (PBP1-ABC) superfamily)